METVPNYLAIAFISTVLICGFIFYKASGYSRVFAAILLLWIILQTFIARSGFYLDTRTVPPRFLAMVGPAFLSILLLFLTKGGRRFIDGLQMGDLTLLHVVRIPVELCLYLLFVYKAVPELMTFEGRNIDILAGITALPVYYYAYVKKRMSAKWLLAWNVAALGLVLNIVINAILAAPFPFQQFAFDQPNIAVLYFPYNLLPAVVVPLVLFSHLVCIRNIVMVLKKK